MSDDVEAGGSGLKRQHEDPDGSDADAFIYDDSLDRELYAAAALGDLARVQELVAKGADVVYINDTDGSRTTLHAAAGSGNAALVQFLTQNGHPYNLVVRLAPNSGRRLPAILAFA